MKIARQKMVYQQSASKRTNNGRSTTQINLLTTAPQAPSNQGRDRRGTTKTDSYGTQDGSSSDTRVDCRVLPSNQQPISGSSRTPRDEQPRRTKLRRLKTPPLHCSICQIGPECPEYHEGYICAFTSEFANLGTRSLDEIIDHLAQLFEDNILRLRRARMTEEILLGGHPDRKTTKLSNLCFRQAMQLANYMRALESTTVVVPGEGILSRIFGHLVNDHDIVHRK